MGFLGKVLNFFITEIRRITYRSYFKKLGKKFPNACKVVLVEPGIGDFCIDMAYLKAFKEYVGKPIVLVAPREYEEFVYLYEGYDKLIFEKKKKLNRINNVLCYRKHWSRYESLHKRNELILCSGGCYITAGITRFRKLNCLEVIRDTVYRLPEEAAIQLPKSLSDMSVKKSKKVLINPFSNTTDMPIEKFYPVVDYFIGLGYEVFTNCKDDKSYCLPQTKARICSLMDLYKSAGQFEYIVSVRSGVLDLLASTDIKQIVFYCDENRWYTYRYLYSMKMWGCVDALELMWDDENAMRKIKAYVEGGNES